MLSCSVSSNPDNNRVRRRKAEVKVRDKVVAQLSVGRLHLRVDCVRVGRQSFKVTGLRHRRFSVIEWILYVRAPSK